MVERIKKEKKMVEEEVVTYHAVLCDLCGKECPHPRDNKNWNVDTYTFDRITIKRESGYAYPQSDFSKEIETFDVCPSCWRQKIVPLFPRAPRRAGY